MKKMHTALQAAIKNSPYTYKELSARTNIPLKTLESLAYGTRKITHANVLTIQKLTKVLHISMDEILRD